MELVIANGGPLGTWLGERRKMGRDVFAITGAPPEGATYDDGEPIVRPVNIAWQDGTSGEVFAIAYAGASAEPTR